MRRSRSLESICGLWRIGNKKNKRKQQQTVELKVRMDCDGCELKIKNALSSMTGVESVNINRKEQKVSVTGYVEAQKVLKRARSTGNKAEMWPYVPYNTVAHPYAAEAYDKKAPPGYVKNTFVSMATAKEEEEEEDRLASMFSDQNPSSCSVM